MSERQLLAAFNCWASAIQDCLARSIPFDAIDKAAKRYARNELETVLPRAVLMKVKGAFDWKNIRLLLEKTT